MKTTRKIVGRLIVGCVLACCLSLSQLQTFAIEGLKVSVQSTNAVLSWPSATNETYIAQYRPSLTSTSSWLTLTNYLPAATNATMTTFSSSSASTNRTGFYRVVRDGAHMWGITNGMVLHDVLITPVEFSVDSTDQVVGVTFYDGNNSPVIGASAQPLNGGAWLLVWNTTLSFNGDYAVYAEINFASDSSVVSQPVTVTANNTISFPNYFSQAFGDQMWIYAETIPNASYSIDMYDENTNYLGSFVDVADGDGVISFIWDLTDGGGNTYDSTNFSGVFTVDTSSSPDLRSQATAKSGSVADFQTASPVRKTFSTKVKANGVHPNTPGSSASANQLWVKEGTWTPNNNWVVAYGLFNGQSGESSQNDVNMITGGPAGEYGGALGTLDQYGLIGNVSPGNSAQNGTVFTVQDQSSRNNLLSYLADHRYENFYFFGHGNDSAIGSYNGFTLTLDQIAFALGNVPLSFPGQDELINIDPPIMVPTTIKPDIQRAALHPYRFVFIDACDTGAGNFCEAFGIPAITVSTNYFKTLGVESRAFVGMQSWKLNLNFIGWTGYSLMTGQFLGNWLSGVDVQTCVGNAQSASNGTGAQMSSSAVVYGAYDLKIDTHTRAL